MTHGTFKIKKKSSISASGPWSGTAKEAICGYVINVDVATFESRVCVRLLKEMMGSFPLNTRKMFLEATG